MSETEAGFSLSPGASAAGYRLAGLETVASTNSLAMQRARDGAPGKLWVVAREQSEGRGRRGRNWQSAKGNIAASLLLRLTAGAEDAALIGFVAGVALVRTISELQPNGDEPVKLKWPNDLLHKGAKLAGILLEAQTLPEKRLVLVVGIGMNVVHSPDGLPYATTSLHDMGLNVSPETVFSVLSTHWAECLDIYSGKTGQADILLEWRNCAAGIGEPVRVAAPQGEITGIFETIDDDGRLIVRTASGSRVPVTAGDVLF